jgi:hypothetical protein
MRESLATHLKRRAAKDPHPRYLDRGFNSVLDESKATFVETIRESRIDLRLAERDLGTRLKSYHSMRAISGEKRFGRARQQEVFFDVGGIKFGLLAPGLFAGTIPDGPQIIVGANVFKQDAEEAISILVAHKKALHQTGISSVTVGVEDDPKYKGRRLGICNTEFGRATFFCDEFGGLLARGLAEITKQDANPCDFERAVLHELGHLLEHNDTCKAAVKAITADIKRFVARDPKHIPAEWMAAAKAINPEYLPLRFSAVLANGSKSSKSDEAHLMAHEFLAELVPAIAWQKKDIQLPADCPASIKELHAYIRKHGHAFSVADKIKKLSTKTIARDKNRILVHSDYLQYHGGGPSRWRSLDSQAEPAAAASRGGR